jgi:hypothetical protein
MTAIPGSSGGGALSRATGDAAPLGSSDGDTPETDKRRRRTPDLVAMAVARGAVGFGSGGGGPDGARRRRIWETHTRRRLLEAGARCRLLGGACPGVAPVGVPPPATTPAFPRRDADDRLP